MNGVKLRHFKTLRIVGIFFFLSLVLASLPHSPFTIPEVQGFTGSSGEFGYWIWDGTNKIMTIIANATANAGDTEAHAYGFQDIVNAIDYYGWSAFYNRSYSGIQFEFCFRMVVGNGTSLGTTWFVDSAKEITFTQDSLSGYWQTLISIRRYGYVRFGILLNEATKSTEAGVDFILINPNWNPTNFFDTTSDWNTHDRQLYVYASSFMNVGNQINRIVADCRSGNTRFWHVLIGQASGITYLPFPSGNPSLSLYDIYFVGGTSAFYGYGSTNLEIDRIFVTDMYQSIWTQNNIDFALSNLVSIRTTSTFLGTGTDADGNYYFINCDVDDWSFQWTASSDGEAWRQYTFDLTATYPNGTAFENANITISNSVEGIIYEGQTDVNGQIPQQTLTMGFYNQTDGIYSYNPYWLNASGDDGSYVYYKSWTVDNLANWEIALLPLVEHEPTARFTFSPSNPTPSQSIAFNGSTSEDPDGYITNYYWTFGDGYSYNSSSPTTAHSYLTTGAYNATLEVTDSQGLKDTFSQIIVVASTDTSTTPSPSIEIYPDYDIQILPLSDYLVHFPFFGESFQATLYLHNKGKFGKETQVTFWIEDENQQKIYEKSESLYVNRLETRDLAVDLTRPAEQGTYTLYAQITSQTRTKTVAQQSFQVYNAIGWLVGPGVIVLVIIVVLVVCAVLVLLKKYVWY